VPELLVAQAPVTLQRRVNRVLDGLVERVDGPRAVSVAHARTGDRCVRLRAELLFLQDERLLASPLRRAPRRRLSTRLR